MVIRLERWWQCCTSRYLAAVFDRTLDDTLSTSKTSKAAVKGLFKPLLMAILTVGFNCQCTCRLMVDYLSCYPYAYCPADATANPIISFKSRLVLSFWYLLTHVVLEKRPLNGCSSSSSYPEKVAHRNLCHLSPFFSVTGEGRNPDSGSGICESRRVVMWYVSPAFSQFFLHCGAFIERAGHQECPLSSALMNLLKEIWSPSWYLHIIAVVHLKLWCFMAIYPGNYFNRSICY